MCGAISTSGAATKLSAVVVPADWGPTRTTAFSGFEGSPEALTVASGRFGVRVGVVSFSVPLMSQLTRAGAGVRV